MPIEVNTIDWIAEHMNLQVDLQLTTQLQEVLKDLTHGLYEDNRGATGSGNSRRLSSNVATSAIPFNLLEGIILALKREVETGVQEEGGKQNAWDA